MQVEIEYPVFIEAIPSRAKNVKTVVFKDRVTVDIPVYGDNDRILAMRTTGKAGRAGRSYWGMGGCLYVDNASWDFHENVVSYQLLLSGACNLLVKDVHEELVEKLKHLRSSMQAQLSSALHPRPLAEALIEGMHWNGVVNNTGRLPIEIQSIDEVTLKEFNQEDIDRQRARFVKHLENFAISSGRLYRKTVEPMYGIDHRNRDGQAVEVSVFEAGFFSEEEFLAEADPTAPYLIPFCSALDHDGAVAIASEFSSKSGAVLVVDDERIEVFHDEYVTEFPDEICQVNVAKSLDYAIYSQILSGRVSAHNDLTWYENLKTCDMRAVHAWRALSDAISTGDVDLINDQVIRALENPLFATSEMTNHAKIWSLFAERWQDKDISISQTLGPKL